MDTQCKADPCATVYVDETLARAEECAPPVIDRNQFKHALGMFATGLTLATTASGDAWHGVTANAVMSVSLEPPLVLLSIQIGSRMYRAMHTAENFALNILSAEQQEIAQYFADSSVSHDTDAFDSIAYHRGLTGAPLLDHALACIDCRIVERYPAGDHLLFLGQVVHLEIGDDREPLLYFRGRFR